MAQEIVYPGKSWATWEDELDSLAENTQDAYRRAFSQVMEAWGTTPEEIFEEKMLELRSEDPRDWRGTEVRVTKLMRDLENAGKSAETASMVKKALSSFYSANGLSLKFRKKNGKRNGHNGQKMITRDEIKHLIEANGVRNLKKNKALHYTLKDSGLRVGDISKLTVGAFMEAKIIPNSRDEPFKVFSPQRTQKCGIYAALHLGPESVLALEEYLAEREAKGEILGEDTPLFIDREGRPYTEKRLSNTVSTICRGKGFKRISSHSFRKFHRTQLERFLPVNWILRLQGKEHDVYSCPSETDLTEMYIRHYDVIRIYGVRTEAEVKKWADTDARVAQLETLVRELIEKYEN